MADPQIVMLLVEQLIPYARNARTHSDAHVAQIAASIKEFGWTNPILIDGAKGIIAGHGRVLAARKLGLTQVPCIELMHLTDAQRRAYIIADNKLALNAGWDDELLKLELTDLSALGFDVSLTGFDLPEIEELFSDSSPLAGEPVGCTKEQLEVMQLACWRQITQEFAEHVRAANLSQSNTLSANVSRGIAAWHFVAAKYLRADYPRWCSLAFCPAQFFTNGEGQSLPELLDRFAADQTVAERVRFGVGDPPSFDKLMKGSLAMRGARMPLDFHATLARDLIDEFTPDGGSVLDPCHGWGGRYVGYLLSKKAKRYVGFDPSPTAHDGLLRIRETLRLFAESDKIDQFIRAPFEDFPELVHDETTDQYDFALTSPPYFDVEKYDGEQQSMKRYPTFESWTQGFFIPLIDKVGKLLKPGAAFALQVGSQRYPLAELAKTHAPQCGFKFTEQRASGMVNNFNETEEAAGEVILILRKV